MVRFGREDRACLAEARSRRDSARRPRPGRPQWSSPSAPAHLRQRSRFAAGNRERHRRARDRQIVAGLTSAPVPDEINYTGGVEFIANPRLTLMGDVVCRTLRGAGRLDLTSKTFEYSDLPGLTARFGLIEPDPQTFVEAGIFSFPTASVSLDEFDPRPGNLTLLLGASGVKFNVAGQPAPVGQRVVSTHRGGRSEPRDGGRRPGLRVLTCQSRTQDDTDEDVEVKRPTHHRAYVTTSTLHSDPKASG